MTSVARIIRKSHEIDLAIPAFRIPDLPGTEPMVRAVRDANQALTLAGLLHP
jgi:hypothetical protein